MKHILHWKITVLRPGISDCVFILFILGCFSYSILMLKSFPFPFWKALLKSLLDFNVFTEKLYNVLFSSIVVKFQVNTS